MGEGTVHQISVSPGGVPKSAVLTATVTATGIVGDDQHDKEHHGGPERAVCLFSREVIERLRIEGHPITAGSTGENLTISGIDWTRVEPGCRFAFEGGVELEVTGYTSPCRTISGSFAGGSFKRISQKAHPGESRVYARVVREGMLTTGEQVTLRPAGE